MSKAEKQTQHRWSASPRQVRREGALPKRLTDSLDSILPKKVRFDRNPGELLDTPSLSPKNSIRVKAESPTLTQEDSEHLQRLRSFRNHQNDSRLSAKSDEKTVCEHKASVPSCDEQQRANFNSRSRSSFLGSLNLHSDSKGKLESAVRSEKQKNQPNNLQNVQENVLNARSPLKSLNASADSHQAPTGGQAFGAILESLESSPSTNSVPTPKLRTQRSYAPSPSPSKMSKLQQSLTPNDAIKIPVPRSPATPKLQPSQSKSPRGITTKARVSIGSAFGNRDGKGFRTFSSQIPDEVDVLQTPSKAKKKKAKRSKKDTLENTSGENVVLAEARRQAVRLRERELQQEKDKREAEQEVAADTKPSDDIYRLDAAPTLDCTDQIEQPGTPEASFSKISKQTPEAPKLRQSNTAKGMGASQEPANNKKRPRESGNKQEASGKEGKRPRKSSKPNRGQRDRGSDSEGGSCWQDERSHQSQEVRRNPKVRKKPHFNDVYNATDRLSTAQRLQLSLQQKASNKPSCDQDGALDGDQCNRKAQKLMMKIRALLPSTALDAAWLRLNKNRGNADENDHNFSEEAFTISDHAVTLSVAYDILKKGESSIAAGDLTEDDQTPAKTEHEEIAGNGPQDHEKLRDRIVKLEKRLKKLEKKG